MVYFFDTFTDTNNTELTAHTPEVGTGWTQQHKSPTPTSPVFRIKTGQTVQAEKVIGLAYYAGIANGPLPADYMVEGEIILNPNASQLTETMVLLARAVDGGGSDKITAYGAGLFTTATNFRKAILKWNNVVPGSPTILFSENFTYDQAYRTMLFSVDGSELSLWMGDGLADSSNVLIARVTDTDITAANEPGVFFELDNTGNNIRIRGGGTGKFPFVVRDLPINHLQRSSERNRLLIENRKRLEQERLASRIDLWR